MMRALSASERKTSLAFCSSFGGNAASGNTRPYHGHHGDSYRRRQVASRGREGPRKSPRARPRKLWGGLAVQEQEGRSDEKDR